MDKRDKHPKHHEKHEAPGYSDEVATETHDIIHNAELEEQRMHGKDALCADDPGPNEEQQSSSNQGGPMGKVKDALNLGK